MPPCHTGEEAYGKKDDVLLVVQKEGTDRFHFAKPIPFLRNGERKEAPVRVAGRRGPLNQPLVAQGGSWDLFVCAKHLFVAAIGGSSRLTLGRRARRTTTACTNRLPIASRRQYHPPAARIDLPLVRSAGFGSARREERGERSVSGDPALVSLRSEMADPLACSSPQTRRRPRRADGLGVSTFIRMVDGERVDLKDADAIRDLVSIDDGGVDVVGVGSHFCALVMQRVLNQPCPNTRRAPGKLPISCSAMMSGRSTRICSAIRA